MLWRMRRAAYWRSMLVCSPVVMVDGCPSLVSCHYIRRARTIGRTAAVRRKEKGAPQVDGSGAPECASRGRARSARPHHFSALNHGQPIKTPARSPRATAPFAAVAMSLNAVAHASRRPDALGVTFAGELRLLGGYRGLKKITRLPAATVTPSGSPKLDRPGMTVLVPPVAASRGRVADAAVPADHPARTHIGIVTDERGSEGCH
jgi:hypothetical protein